jgi:membrane fusion protein (multidrug efflux system)
VVQPAESGLVVEYRQVQTGVVRDGDIEIETGLQAGERVVSAGQLKLRNGMPVGIDDSVRLEDAAGGP